MTKSPKDYSQGKIYVIRNHCNSMVYVGHTTQALSKRFSYHKKDMNKDARKGKIYTAMRELGRENFYIELIENFPCQTEEELTAREGHFIREFNSVNNGYNCNIAGRSKKEWKVDNKELVKKLKKESNERNQEHIKQHRKEYYEQNKEKILDKCKELYTCECGKELTYSHKSRHLKSKTHLDYINNKNNI